MIGFASSFGPPPPPPAPLVAKGKDGRMWVFDLHTRQWNWPVGWYSARDVNKRATG